MLLVIGELQPPRKGSFMVERVCMEAVLVVMWDDSFLNCESATANAVSARLLCAGTRRIVFFISSLAGSG